MVLLIRVDYVRYKWALRRQEGRTTLQRLRMPLLTFGLRVCLGAFLLREKAKLGANAEVGYAKKDNLL